MSETTYLSPKDFSEHMTGISEKLVRKLLKQGVIPALRSGRAALIPLQAGIDAIELYVVAQQQQKPKPYEFKTVSSIRQTRPGKMTDIQRARIEAARKSLGLENEGKLP